MLEARFGHPFPLFDDFAVHHRDLRRRATEGQEADAQPHAQRLAEGREALHGQVPRRIWLPWKRSSKR